MVLHTFDSFLPYPCSMFGETMHVIAASSPEDSGHSSAQPIRRLVNLVSVQSAVTATWRPHYCSVRTPRVMA